MILEPIGQLTLVIPCLACTTSDEDVETNGMSIDGLRTKLASFACPKFGCILH